MRISALLLLLPVLLPAQPPAQAPAKTVAKPEDLCSLSGRILNGVTGEPIRRATLNLMRADPSPNDPPLLYTTSSNAEGQFAMKDIEPGKYRLNATRNGFVSLVYGARNQMRPGTTLTFIRQQQMTDLTLKMTPHGVVVGRILDEEGEPVANARVMLQSYRYVTGRKQLSPSGGATVSNDLGEYRVFGIAPGKYFLSVTPAPTNPGFAQDRSVSSGPDEDYVATYYPGTIDPAAAAQIDVSPGAQLRGMNMTLSKMRAVTLRGRVTHGLPGRQNIQVLLTSRNPAALMSINRSSPADATGNFTIRYATPGAYFLVAIINEPGGSRQGRLPVDVGNAPMEGLVITIGPGITVKGQVRSDPDGSPVDLSGVRLMLQQRETNVFGGSWQGKAEQDGTFEVKNVSPDRYNLVWYGMPANAYVKSARSDQTDVLVSGLDLSGGGPPPPLEIVVSSRAASVTGSALNEKTGSPAPGATVVLVPQEKERRDQQSYFKMIVTDQHGAYSLTGVPPGEYKAYAWEDIEPGAYMDPDVMKAVELKGESITLREGEQKNLPLKLIAADN